MLLKILEEVKLYPDYSLFKSSPEIYLPESNIKRKLLLTSTGFENPNIGRLFLNTIDMEPSKLRILFVDTAAISEEDKSILSECYNELYNLGIINSNITTKSDLKCLTIKECSIDYDCIYVAGGDENYLLNHINNSGFRNVLLSLINQYNKYYIGVSAGSYICGSLIPNNLNIIKNPLDVHCTKNIANDGIVENNLNIPIYLSDRQALYIENDLMKVIS